MINSAIPLYLKCIEECHIGSGESVNIIDLPIQREKHTGFPFITSNSLKGSLREHFENVNDDEVKNLYLFGHEQSAYKKLNAESKKEYPNIDRAGSIAITDSRLLLFPVRSYYGIWAYITCPYVLKNFATHYNTYVKPESPISFKDLDNCIDLVSDESKIYKSEQNHNFAYLEEHKLSLNISNNQNFTDNIITLINQTNIQNLFENILIVQDEIFSYFTNFHTIISPHNKISDQGISENLFYEEMLNCESILYSFVFDSNIFANYIFEESSPSKYFKKILNQNNIFQIGAGQTTGKGIINAII